MYYGFTSKEKHVRNGIQWEIIREKLLSRPGFIAFVPFLCFSYCVFDASSILKPKDLVDPIKMFVLPFDVVPQIRLHRIFLHGEKIFITEILEDNEEHKIEILSFVLSYLQICFSLFSSPPLSLSLDKRSFHIYNVITL